MALPRQRGVTHRWLDAGGEGVGVGVVRVRTVEEHVDAEDADELLEDREGDLDLNDG